MTTPPAPKLVRESAFVTWSEARKQGSAVDAWIARWVDATHERALATAALIGIVRPHVHSYWDQYYVCGVVERPMSLCGPGAPQIETWRQCFEHDYRDNPIAQYTVVIRDQDEEDASLAAWKARQAEDAAGVKRDEMVFRETR